MLHRVEFKVRSPVGRASGAGIDHQGAAATRGEGVSLCESASNRARQVGARGVQSGRVGGAWQRLGPGKSGRGRGGASWGESLAREACIQGKNHFWTD